MMEAFAFVSVVFYGILVILWGAEEYDNHKAIKRERRSKKIVSRVKFRTEMSELGYVFAK